MEEDISCLKSVPVSFSSVSTLLDRFFPRNQDGTPMKRRDGKRHLTPLEFAKLFPGIKGSTETIAGITFVNQAETRYPFLNDISKVQAGVMATMGSTIDHIAKTLGVNHATAKRWSEDPMVLAWVEVQKRDLSEMLDTIIRLTAGALTDPEKIKDASLATLSSVLDTAIKNQQLVTGKPTTITSGTQDDRMGRLVEKLLGRPELVRQLAERAGILKGDVIECDEKGVPIVEQ